MNITTDKAVDYFRKQYEKALNSTFVERPISLALYQTWRHFDAIEPPREFPKPDIAIMTLSTRSFNCLRRAGITTIEDLTSHTADEIKRIRNMGTRSFEEIQSKLEKMGLSLKEDA